MLCLTCQGLKKNNQGKECWDCLGTGYNTPRYDWLNSDEQQKADAIREDAYDDIRKGIEK